MSLQESIHQLVHDTLEKIREPMGLSGWTIHLNSGPMADTAATSSDPEYKQGLIELDPEKLKTGDDVTEFVIHEAVHLHNAWVEKTADDLADAWADSLPEPGREAVRRYVKEQIRRGTEAAATRLGHSFLRLFRRLWALEGENKQLRAELKAAKKAAIDARINRQYPNVSE